MKTEVKILSKKFKYWVNKIKKQGGELTFQNAQKAGLKENVDFSRDIGHVMGTTLDMIGLPEV